MISATVCVTPALPVHGIPTVSPPVWARAVRKAQNNKSPGINPLRNRPNLLRTKDRFDFPPPILLLILLCVRLVWFKMPTLPASAKNCEQLNADFAGLAEA